MTEVEEYFDGLDAASRDAFRRSRAIAPRVAPDAEDGRSYGMAGLRHGGKPLLGFRAAQEHVSVCPFSPEAVDAVRGRLTGFDLSKGAVRSTADRPLPDDVVADLVRHRPAGITG
ncbi:iron chaperone [Streptomyces roseolus]|uniref:iron chaperone n=1 Tax=Streptomyces roseolus TaxID=67358 RepID=UPI00378A50C2